jgi:general secretion pathway protein C
MFRMAAAPSSVRPASPWAVRGLTLLVWALAAASVAYWALRLVGPSGVPAGVPVASAGAPALDAMAVARVLGATPQKAVATAAPGPRRYVLTGVVADRRQGGAALIAVNGLPPKPYRVGSEIEPGVRLASVGPRRAVLATDSDASAPVQLELPPLIGQ